MGRRESGAGSREALHVFLQKSSYSRCAGKPLMELKQEKGIVMVMLLKRILAPMWLMV